MIANKLLMGSAVMVLKRWAVRVLSLVSTMIMARLLLPADYGLLALALSFAAMFEVLATFNLDMALIRHKNPQDQHFHTAWTLNVLGHCVITLALLLSSPLLADFSKAPDLMPVIWSIALCFFLDGLRNIGMVHWHRQLVFSKEMILEIVGKVIEIAVAVTWALISPSVWALIAGMVAGRVSALVLSFLLHPFRPRFGLQYWRELAGFSGWALGFNFVMQLAQRTDHFIVSRLHGLTGVGLYANAQTLASLPTVELAMPISRALFPGFSSMVGEPERLREAYLKALNGLLLIALPLAIGLAFVADAAVFILFGPKWMDATPITQGLALAQVLSISTASSVPLLMALGQVRGLFFRALALLAIRPVLAYTMLTSMGMAGLPWAVGAAIGVQVVLDSWMIRRSLHFSLGVWVTRTWRPYVSVGITALALAALLPTQLPPSDMAQALLKLLITFAIGAPTYIVSAFTLWTLSGRPDGLEATLDRHLRQRLSR